MKILAVIALMIGIGSVPAFADAIYDFTYNGGYFTATGTLDLNGSGLALSGSGTLTYGSVTTAITLFPLNAAMLADPSGNGVRAGGTDWNQIDNQVYIGSNPLVDGYGLIFWTGSTTPTGALADTGSTHPNFCSGIANPCTVGGWNVYYYDGTYQSFGANAPSTGLYNGEDGAFTLTYIPEGGGTTLTLLGLAVAGLAGLRRKLGV